MRLSIRHDTKIYKSSAVQEVSQSGIGVSVRVRKHVRQYVPNAAHMANAELNEMIANEFAKGEPVHRFKLRSGEIAEIRRSTNFYYIAVMRGRGTANVRYDIIVIQPSYKQVSDEEEKKRRLQHGWGVQ